MELDTACVEDAIARLRRIEGQVGGLIRMVEDGRECREVIQQIAAANGALRQVGFRLLASGLRYCRQDPEQAKRAGYSEEELERLFLRLA
jgi:CsoR family transcriptional regulator, copper-sensing transcriptional repressor